MEIDLKGDIAEAVHAKGVDPSSKLEGQVARRAQRSLALTPGARLLWIDEHPTNSENEVRLFKRLGMAIYLAASDTDATKQLAAGVYDVVISSWTGVVMARLGRLLSRRSAQQCSVRRSFSTLGRSVTSRPAHLGSRSGLTTS